jgi:glycosyltransferase involved in cell wall biosynthesis
VTTSARPPRLTVVIMAFNEAASLEEVVSEVGETLTRLGMPAETLIVDDGSTDGTAELADRLAAARADVRVVHHVPNGGLGAVYRTGFTQARGELLTFFPADGQFPAAILETFVPAIEAHDLVLGYVSREDSRLGLLLSAAERAAYRLLLGPLPRFQGVFLVRRDALARTVLRSQGRGWAIVMEMLVRAQRDGWRVRSLPTVMRPRRSGVSKVQNVRTIWSNLRQVVALRGLI